MKLALLCLLLAVGLLLPETSAFRKQRVAAKGTLLCGTRPAANVRVKLIDDDTGPDPDDELDAGYTDSQGRFHLSGDTRELTTIDPRLKAYHDCNDHGLPCQRRLKIIIPDKYININTPFDLGTINLEVEQDDEERDCFN